MNIIVTAGGTSEPIDNVRRIANTGTGRLGSLVADELAEADWTGHIFYVCAKDSIRPVSKRVTCVEIQSVADLQEAVTELTEKYVIHGVVHSMAVSDYKVRSVSTIDSLSEYLENRSAETGDLQKKIVQGIANGLDAYFSERKAPAGPLAKLEKSIQTELSRLTSKWDVWVEDLTDGTSIHCTQNIEENQPMVSASLIKLFIMGAVYDKIETGVVKESDVSEKLEQMITVSGSKQPDDAARKR